MYERCLSVKTFCWLLLIICGALFNFSCNSDSDDEIIEIPDETEHPEPPAEGDPHPAPFEQINCKPVGLYPANEADPDDSLSYEYNAEGRLRRILHFAGEELRDFDLIEYDALGRVYWLKKTRAGTGVIFEHYQFVYDGNSTQPTFLYSWGTYLSNRPFATVFRHDNKKRLIYISRDDNTKWRYEYDDNDNVRRVFHAAGHRPDEFLGRENHTFDNRKKFYANEPALVTIYNYMLRFDPGKNNVTSASIHYVGPLDLTGFAPPRELAYKALYDDNGWVWQHDVDDEGQVAEFYCRSVRYSCD